MAALKLLATAGVAAAAAAGAAHAAVITYTESQSDSTHQALGYPVPIPAASQTAFDGFREYDSLIAHLEGLAIANATVLRSQAAGASLAGRPIPAFELSDADATTWEAPVAEPAVLVTAGVHAREWQAPEAAAQLVERLVAASADGGFHEYLLDNTALTVVPVLNPDGFLQTQRFPDRALESESVPGEDGATLRDGRMRRKNMRCDGCPEGRVDESLDAGGDGMFGVDVNRNHEPFWGGQGSSGNARSLVYRGAASGSEPEAQALYAAAALAPADRLRLYVDLHSFKRAFLSANTDNGRRNGIQRQLANAMRAAAGGAYCYAPTDGGDAPAACNGSPSPPGAGIGSSDEHFANVHGVPAYTLEIEPGIDGADDYGGAGAYGDGFILPESQIARVRDEVADMLLLGAYRQAGPPSIARVEIRKTDGGAVVYAAAWRVVDAGRRDLEIEAALPLDSEVSYTLWLAFSKPMRWRSDAGAVAQYPGRSVPLAPAMSLEATRQDGSTAMFPIAAIAGNWLGATGGAPDGSARYADDAIATQFTLPASFPTAGLRRLALVVAVQDLSGLSLDADPSTVAGWAGGAWARYEDEDGDAGDNGGADRSIRLIDDGSTGIGGGGGGGLAAATLLALAALRRFRRQR